VSVDPTLERGRGVGGGKIHPLDDDLHAMLPLESLPELLHRLGAAGHQHEAGMVLGQQLGKLDPDST
jgi:hypothetical protein